MPINPEDDHLLHLRQVLQVVGRGGNLVSDAHIAAIAIEHEAEVHTYNERDFARFPRACDGETRFKPYIPRSLCPSALYGCAAATSSLNVSPSPGPFGSST